MDIYNRIVKQKLIEAFIEILQKIESREIINPMLSIAFDKNNKELIFPKINTNDKFITIGLYCDFKNLNVRKHGFSIDLDFIEKNNTITRSVYIPYDSIVLISESAKDFFIDLRGITNDAQIEKEKERRIEEDFI